jgi:beta-phosphoglucomutase-like phosphatase (HAD superfamily)
VERGKPDPEIYLLVASELDVPPANCLVIEDSPAGVKAALAAGMHCVAVTTPFTRERIHAGQLLDEGLIVDDPSELPEVVRRVMEESKLVVRE